MMNIFLLALFAVNMHLVHGYISTRMSRMSFLTSKTSTTWLKRSTTQNVIGASPSDLDTGFSSPQTINDAVPNLGKADASMALLSQSILHGSTTSFIQKEGEVTLDDLSPINLLKIVQESASDIDTNVLLWKCLGYSYSGDEKGGKWNSDKVFPKWKAKFPTPPDLIGVTRRYDPETDKEVRNASMDLMRSIPRSFKGGVKSLQSVGFTGKILLITVGSSSLFLFGIRVSLFASYHEKKDIILIEPFLFLLVFHYYDWLLLLASSLSLGLITHLCYDHNIQRI